MSLCTKSPGVWQRCLTTLQVSYKLSLASCVPGSIANRLAIFSSLRFCGPRWTVRYWSWSGPTIYRRIRDLEHGAPKLGTLWDGEVHYPWLVRCKQNIDHYNWLSQPIQMMWRNKTHGLRDRILYNYELNAPVIINLEDLPAMIEAAFITIWDITERKPLWMQSVSNMKWLGIYGTKER